MTIIETARASESAEFNKGKPGCIIATLHPGLASVESNKWRGPVSEGFLWLRADLIAFHSEGDVARSKSKASRLAPESGAT
jgi:hypothetical protein